MPASTFTRIRHHLRKKKIRLHRKEKLRRLPKSKGKENSLSLFLRKIRSAIKENADVDVDIYEFGNGESVYDEDDDGADDGADNGADDDEIRIVEEVYFVEEI